MATQIDVQPTPFPAKSKTATNLVSNARTTATLLSFADKLLLTITQPSSNTGVTHWLHVPMASPSTDPFNPGLFPSHDTENELLPMPHLTATTVLGGTKRDEEVVGQTLATTIASAILMKRPAEERMLVLGIGIKGLGSFGREQFNEIVGLMLEVL